MTWEPIVSAEFDMPTGLVTDLFFLEPLSECHNEADHAAWTSSVDHIRATPGFVGRQWPDRIFNLEENAVSIGKHEDHAKQRVGFTYAVIERCSGQLIGSVYFYPPRRAGYDVDVRSWVRADRAHLDTPLYETVSRWLSEQWPFERPDYAERRCRPVSR